MNFWNDKPAAAQGMKNRADVDPAITWDLDPVFPSDEAWAETFDKVKEAMPELSAAKGKLAESGQVFYEHLQTAEKISRDLARLYVYASMRSDQDKSNSDYTTLLDRAGQLAAQMSAALAWQRPEIAAMGQDKVEDLIKEEPKLELYRHEFDELFRGQKHLLSSEEEALLASAGEVLDTPSSVFSVFNNADLEFPDVADENGDMHPLNHASYSRFLESRDRVLRQNTFQEYYKVYHQFRNTLAMTLSRQMKRDNFIANVRGFKSAREAALFYNAIDEKVHDQLLDVINNNLGLMHRYVQLKKDLLDLDELHCYDLYVPTFVAESKTYTIEEAKEIILNALKPLGEEYQKILHKAFDERWIDFAVNKGKRTGAYSGGCYDSAPYVLISWQGTLNNLFTLAHELGHSCHSYLTRENQPYVYGNYSIFLAEIASTTNENLLTQYLLQHETDETILNHLRMNWIDGFKSTIFRQSQFAEFEHKIHLAEQQGTALSADYLCNLYAEINKKYYGDALDQDDEIALEWARIPHFYYNYYVYQYATGFAAAVTFADSIMNGGEAERDRYLAYLSAGSSDYPLEVLEKAGLNMREAAPIERAMKKFDEELTRLEAAVQKMKA